MQKTLLLILGALSFTLSVVATDVIEPSTRLCFPSEVHFEDNNSDITLNLAGTAVRSKFFINIYAIGYYLHNPVKMKRAAVFDEMLKDGQIKQFTIKWVYEADLKTVQEAFFAGFHKTLTDEEYKSIEPLIKEYISLYTDGTKKGDEHVLRWFPGNMITLEINGENKGKIAHPVFAKGLWRIWFDSKSIVSRNKLVKNLLD
ncbi:MULTISPECIES: chalcone isomerase family protein [Parachlamydia]|jgi:hypothetical protein|uniref:Chalcone isomerase domain-containing protein n=2 Tax=Parachlamydia acanthamoebae TaxID=83552 RepID=F8KWR2_PARAV|nr:chalcone isomerase family protein [Parachlamydia acanthamoebae]EFB42317.1 hypothetical protein pah_c012o031 [Parachlamydia acanthamoebae str. Hall's coccus]CCB86100.1 putative uncharacterized protein [Parachlamydia acanthamoebae UV-7]